MAINAFAGEKSHLKGKKHLELHHKYNKKLLIQE